MTFREIFNLLSLFSMLGLENMVAVDSQDFQSSLLKNTHQLVYLFKISFNFEQDW